MILKVLNDKVDKLFMENKEFLDIPLNNEKIF